MKPLQVSKDFPNAFYRVTTKGLYVKDGKVMLVHDFTGRSDTDPRPDWDMPGGGLYFGESFSDALKRELKEEMNLVATKISSKPVYVYATKHGTGRGMEWYYVLTLVFQIELENLNFTSSDECREIKFFSKKDLQDNIADLASQVVPLAELFNPEDFTKN